MSLQWNYSRYIAEWKIKINFQDPNIVLSVTKMNLKIFVQCRPCYSGLSGLNLAWARKIRMVHTGEFEYFRQSLMRSISAEHDGSPRNVWQLSNRTAICSKDSLATILNANRACHLGCPNSGLALTVRNKCFNPTKYDMYWWDVSVESNKINRYGNFCKKCNEILSNYEWRSLDK